MPWDDDKATPTTTYVPASSGWDDDPNPAKEAVRLSSGIGQDEAAKVLDLAKQRNLPTDFVSRNVDEIQTQQDNSKLTPEFSQKNPVTSQYIAENTHQAALASPDAPMLGSVENWLGYMGTQGERGALDVERQFRGMLQGFGYSDPSNESRIQEINNRFQTDLNKPAPGPVSSILGKAVETIPMMGGAAAAGVGAAALGAPALVGAAATFGALGFGDMYLDLKNRKDDQGAQLIDDATARGFAAIGGVGQAALFGLPMGKWIQQVPGLRVLERGALNSIIESPTLSQGVKAIAKRIGESAATMGGFTGFSSLIKSSTERLAAMKADGTLQNASPVTILENMFPAEDLDSAVKAGTSGAITGGIFGVTTGAVDTASDYRNFTKSMDTKNLYYAQKYNQAITTADGWNSISTALKSSKMAKIAPSQVETLISRMAPDGQVYMPMEQWQTYWEGKKEDPRAAFNETTGNTTAYDESMRTGADLQIPTSKYASKIATSDHSEYFNSIIRSEPLAMNAEEAKQSTSITKQLDKEKEESANKIKDSVVPPPLPEPETEPITAAPDIHTQEAQTVQAQTPLFEKSEGMSKDFFEDYRQAIDQAGAKAKEDVARDIIDRQLKQKSNAWLAERKSVENDVRDEISSQREYAAIDALKKHTGLEGAEISRLSGDAIKNDLGIDPSQLPDGTYVKNGGIHPDEAAWRLGYESGSELVHDIATALDKEQAIKAETDQRMMDRHPEVSEGNIVDNAMESIHNEQRAKVLRLELKHLTSDDFAAFKGLVRKIGRRIPTTEEIRSESEEVIGQKTSGETQPQLYQRSEALASREAQEHFLRGDFNNAFEAKLRELRNHELYRAAIEAKEQSLKDRAYASKFDRDSVRSRIGRAGADYLKQIDAIRDAFDFSKVTGPQLESRKSLREFVQDQKDAGFNPVVPEDLLDKSNKRSWKELSNDEVHRIVDSMRNIDHLSGLKNKLLASLKQRTFDELRDKVTARLTERFDITPKKLSEPYDENPSLGMKIKTGMNVAGAWLTRFEPLFRMVGLHDEFYESINKAEDFKTSELRKAQDHIVNLLSDYTKQERARFGRTTYIPELEGTGLSPNRSRISVLMSLLHAGNEGNLRELMRGYKLDENHLRAMWKTLTPKDIELAKNVWDFVGSYKDSIGKQERDLNGIEPEWINGRPFNVTLSDGSKHSLYGGYFPLVYDRNVSFRTAALGEGDSIQDMFPGFQRNTATKHNWTEARVGGGGQAPSLQWNVFTNHIADVVHDLAYRKPIIDLHRIINDESIREHLQAGLGKGVYGELNPWLKRIAGDRQWTPLGPLESLRALSNNMTMAELGIKVGSAMVHMTSILPATREVGLGHMAQGFKTFLQPEKATKWMWENSEFMKSRWDDAGDRDIRNSEASPNLLNTQKGFLSEFKHMSPIQQKDAFMLMRAADISIAGPTWYAGYYHAMDGKVKDINAHDHEASVGYADELVRNTKGSGSVKDLAPYQSYGGQVGKLFTMFQTQLNVIANQMMNVGRQAKVDKDWGKVASGIMATWIGPAIGAQLLRGRFPSDDEGWLKWGLKSTAEFPFEVNPMTQPFVRFLEHPEDKLTLLPVEEALGSMAKTGLNIASKNAITDKLTDSETEWTKKDYEEAFMTIGYLKGIPTRQIMQSTLRLNGWMSGEEPHDNPIAGAYSVLTGTRSKD